MAQETSNADNLAVIFITKDEGRGIERAVTAARKHFPNVHVVDSFSSDDTAELAQDAGATVHQFKWNGAYPKKKQWCLDNIATEAPWVLLLDGDELVSDEFAECVKRALHTSGSSVDAWDAPIEYTFAGAVLKHGYTVTKRVLLRRTAVAFPEVGDLTAPGIGEVEGHYQPVVAGTAARLGARLRHEDPDPVSTWFARHNKYSDWEAWLLANPEVRSRVRASKTRQGAIFDLLPFKAFTFFIYAYIVRGGFKDGRSGFDYCFALSVYRWQIGLKHRENIRQLRQHP